MANIGIINQAGFNALKNNSVTLTFSTSNFSNYLSALNFEIKDEYINNQKIVNLKFGLNPYYYNYVFYQDSNQYNYVAPCFLTNWNGKYYLFSGVYNAHNLTYTDVSSGNMNSYFVNSSNSSFKFIFQSLTKPDITNNTGLTFYQTEPFNIYYYSPFNSDNMTLESNYNLCTNTYLCEDGYQDFDTPFNFSLLDDMSYSYNFNGYIYSGYCYSSIDLTRYYRSILKSADIQGYVANRSDLEGIYSGPLLPVHGLSSKIINFDMYYGDTPSSVSGFNYLGMSNLIQNLTFNDLQNLYYLQSNYSGLYMYDSYGMKGYLDQDLPINQTTIFYNTGSGSNDNLYLTNRVNYRNIDARTNNLTMYNQSKEILNSHKLKVDNPLISTWYFADIHQDYNFVFKGFELTQENLTNYFLDDSYLETQILQDYYKNSFNYMFNLSIAGISIGVVLTSILILNLLIFFLKRIVE